MKRIGNLILLIIICITIAACGKTTKESEQETVGYSAAWKEVGLKYLDKMVDLGLMECSYYEKDRTIVPEMNPGFDYSEHLTAKTYLGPYRYVFHSFNTDAGWVYYMSAETPKEKEPTRREILSGEGMQGQILFADGVKESDIAILLGDRKEEGSFGLFVLHLDEQGNVLSKEEVTEGYRNGTEKDWNDWWCDEQGYGYLLTGEEKVITVRNRKGEKVFATECPEIGSNIVSAFHAPGGEVIFVQNRNNRTAAELFWLDVKEQKRKELVSFNQSNLRQFTMVNDGTILFTEYNYLMRWDPVSGERVPLFSYMGSTIPDTQAGNRYTEYVYPGEEGEIYIFTKYALEDPMYVITDKKEDREDCIRLMDMTGGDSYISSTVRVYNYLDNDVNIRFDSGWGEDAWNLLMAEFAMGKGPDMIVIPSIDEHMQILSDKGLLANLREYVSASTLSEIFSGILAEGTVDGKLVGLGVTARPESYIVSNQLWEEKQWTIEDIIQILDSHPDMEGLVLTDSPFGRSGFSSNLDFLVCGHLENSPFIDWEKKTCNFDTPLFRKALEYSKRLANEKQLSEDIPMLLGEGKYLVANIAKMDNLYGYIETSRAFGEKYHIIGMAGQQEFSGYWAQTNMILVNKNTKYSKQIAEFLELMVGEENQKKEPTFWEVRKDVARYYMGYYVFKEPLTEAEKNKLLEGLDSFGPSYYRTNAVSDIIQEEAESYFNGTRTAEDVAKIINNRVQLYLNE